MIEEVAAIAMKFDGFPYWKYFPTPDAVARDIRKTVTTIEDLLAELDKTLCNYMDPATEGLIFPPLATLAAAQAALTALRAELRPRLDALTAMGSRSSRNAVKAHIEYWNELTRLWLKHVPNAAGRRFWRRPYQIFDRELVADLSERDNGGGEAESLCRSRFIANGNVRRAPVCVRYFLRATLCSIN